MAGPGAPSALLDALSHNAAPGDAVSTQIMDAALAEFRQFGIRRASLDEVARGAGVSRMTVHRRFPGKPALVRAVLQREVRRFLEEMIAAIPEHGLLADRTVAVFTAGVPRAVSDPLLRRLLDSDREAVLPFLTVEAGGLVDSATGIIAQTLAADPQAASVPAGRLEHAAAAMVRLAHSAVLSSTPDDLDQDALRALAAAVLTPLLAG